MKRVAFATYSGELAGPADETPVLEELARRSIEAGWRRWDDASVDWGEFDLVVPRATWDYHTRPGEFLAWIDRVAASTRFENPPGIVRWNAHKAYLLDLAQTGTEIVPTELVTPGRPATLAEVRQRRGWSSVVVKPAIGGDSYRLRVERESGGEAAESAFRELLRAGDVLVQPYLERVHREGERSLVFFDGEFSHACAYPTLLDEKPRRVRSYEPSNGELRTARSTLGALPATTLYARLDYLPSGSGDWCLSELELIEPELLFRGGFAGASRFADRIADRLGIAPAGRGP